MGTAPLVTYRERGEPKWGSSLNNMADIALRRSAPTPPVQRPYPFSDRIQELPYALGTVARRTDEGGHHGCTPKVRRVTHSLSVYSFQIQQWLQCFPELVIRHGFQPDSKQSHCLPVLFIGQLFVCCLSLPP